MRPIRSPQLRVSLARALSKLGVLSRSEAAKAILEGRVACNGVVRNNPEFRVDPKRDRFALDGKALDPRPQRVYFMLHKPRGLVTTRKDEKGRATVFECLQGLEAYVFPVGRLDADSEGLLLFTNDSRFAETVTNPLTQIPKRYEVELDRPLGDGDLFKLAVGVAFPDGSVAKPRSVQPLDADRKRLEIVLEEGKNREIRRICEAAGFEVKKLFRTHVGDLALGDLAPGKYRALDAKEVSAALCGRAPKFPPRPGKRGLSPFSTSASPKRSSRRGRKR